MGHWRSTATGIGAVVIALVWVGFHDGTRGEPRLEDSSIHDPWAALTERFRAPGPAQPLSIAAGQMDGDGIADLLIGSADGAGGRVSLYHGTIGDAPFLPAGASSPLPEAPDLLATGDFDADGRTDVVAGALGSSTIYVLLGDGTGGLAPAEPIALDGAMTAWVVGEIDRRDGLDDLVVAIGSPSGPAVQIFASRRGALRDSPETVALPDEAVDLALGQFDDAYPLDLAVAAGDELLILRGRATRIDTNGPDETARRVDGRYRFPETVTSVVSGRFTRSSSRVMELAVLLADGSVRVIGISDPAAIEFHERWRGATPVPGASLQPAKLSTGAGDGLLVLDRAARRLVPISASGAAPRATPAALDLEGAPAAVLSMRLDTDGLDDLVVLEKDTGTLRVFASQILATFVVDAAADDPDVLHGDGTCATLAGFCTLRAAIEEANASAGADTIQFDLGVGNPVIFPASPLPTITDTVTVLGDTGGATRIRIDGFLTTSANGLTLGTGSDGSVLRSLVIYAFDIFGIKIESDNNFVEDCYLGTDASGGGTVTGNFRGLDIDGATGNTIGGLGAAATNVISNNVSQGIRLTGGSMNVVIGNRIGTDPTGAVAVGNGGDGVFCVLGEQNSTIGGMAAFPGKAPGNVISGNSFSGVNISEFGADGNLVQGNVIGTTVSGAALGNGTRGVFVHTLAIGNTVGGSTAMARNVISANGAHGVEIFAASGNAVEGNYIGVGFNGLAALPNSGNGVLVIAGSSSSTVGGASTTPGEPPGNVISGNLGHGVLITSGISATTNVSVSGNLIGLDATGASALGNGLDGVHLDNLTTSNTIGGNTLSDRNVISGNGSDGVEIADTGTVLNEIRGNFIGLDVSGTAIVGNTLDGVRIGSDDNTVGAPAPAPGTPPGNVISGNGSDGVEINGIGVSGNSIVGNLIGTDSTGTAARANLNAGILIVSAHSNIIGGGTPGERNVISGHDAGALSDGIRITASSQNVIQGNSIGVDINAGALGNNGDGIRISASLLSDADANTIGGIAAGQGNIIAANGGNGVHITGDLADSNSVSGNLIGTVPGGAALGNGLHGVLIEQAHDNIVGGIPGTTAGGCTGSCNTIANNGGDGIRIDGGAVASANNIRRNGIALNGLLGIDLGADGVTANDALDGDGGENALQNFPLVASVFFDGANTTIDGTLESTPSTTFAIDAFGSTAADPSGFGEGEVWLDSASCTTGVAGSCSFTLVGPGGYPFVTLTAINPLRNASEFSPIHSHPAEASPARDMTAAPRGVSAVAVSYTPACGASDHVIYWGTGPIAGSINWTNAACAQGVSGTANFDPGALSPGGWLYFVVVGQNPVREGSYGLDGGGAERSEAAGFGACDQPRILGDTCP